MTQNFHKVLFLSLPLVSLGEHLFKHGYVVVPLKAGPVAAKNLKTSAKCLRKALSTSPEFIQEHKRAKTYSYKTPQGNDKTVPLQLVGGGFAALGNPSSVHNKWARRLREWAMSVVFPVFRNYLKLAVPDDDERGLYRLEQIIDRVLQRQPGEKATKESKHQDLTPAFDGEFGSEDGDHIFGGWKNLTQEDQHFSCFPGTHHFVRKGKEKKTGFTILTADDLKDLDLSGKKLVVVPPGATLVFIQSLVHEVFSRAAKHEIFRIFLAFRLTKSHEPMQRNIGHILDTQGMPLLKSGQVIRTYPRLWLTNHPDRLEAWAKALFPAHLLTSKKRKGLHVLAPPEHFPSLVSSGCTLHSPYSLREKNIYTPNQVVTVLAPNSKRRKVTLTL